MSTPERTIRATFPSAPEQVRQARHCFSAWLGPDHPANDSAVLLLSETFTNSSRYGPAGTPHPAIEVSAVLLDNVLQVEVVDGGGDSDPVQGSDLLSYTETGRGLAILDLAAKEWGWERLCDGRMRVWFILDF
jgi:anti-sigma regulatory factor (Ser/Thr protein kinase)